MAVCIYITLAKIVPSTQSKYISMYVGMVEHTIALYITHICTHLYTERDNYTYTYMFSEFRFTTSPQPSARLMFRWTNFCTTTKQTPITKRLCLEPKRMSISINTNTPLDCCLLSLGISHMAINFLAINLKLRCGARSKLALANSRDQTSLPHHQDLTTPSGPSGMLCIGQTPTKLDNLKSPKSNLCAT